MNIYLDIETIPCQDARLIEYIAKDVKPPATMKKAETIAEWEKNDKQGAIDDAVAKTGLDGAFGQIVCIGVAFNDGEIYSFHGNSESDILVAFFESLDFVSPKFIGHNLTAFDLRFIYHRAVVNGIKPPASFPINPKSWDNCLYDTMTQWAGHGGKISLDKLCTILGIEGKSSEFTWQDVLPAYLKGDFNSISDYCKRDVEMVRQVYKRLNFEN